MWPSSCGGSHGAIWAPVSWRTTSSFPWVLTMTTYSPTSGGANIPILHVMRISVAGSTLVIKYLYRPLYLSFFDPISLLVRSLCLKLLLTPTCSPLTQNRQTSPSMTRRPLKISINQSLTPSSLIRPRASIFCLLSSLLTCTLTFLALILQG